MIKCVFFDFDEVVRSWQAEMAGLDGVFGFSLQEFAEIAFTPESVDPAIRGEITDDEWRANVGRTLAERFPDGDVERAMKMWASRAGQLNPEVIKIVQECKAKLPVALFTNATDKLNSDLEKLGIADLFDYVVNASEIGSIKPEPEIYRHAAKLVGIEPHEAFFTDDKQWLVDPAVKLGWTGHVFEGADGLRAALVKAGVL